jgi:hypothetical protein
MTTTEITNLYHRRRRQERWQSHSAIEREALTGLALAITRYLAQVAPGNRNNAAFLEYAQPHLEKFKQVLATAKPRRISMLRRTLEITEQTADRDERIWWELCATLAIEAWMNASLKE